MGAVSPYYTANSANPEHVYAAEVTFTGTDHCPQSVVEKEKGVFCSFSIHSCSHSRRLVLDVNTIPFSSLGSDGR